MQLRQSTEGKFSISLTPTAQSKPKQVKMTKEERTQITNIRKKIGDLTTDPEDIKKIIRKKKQIYTQI